MWVRLPRAAPLSGVAQLVEHWTLNSVVVGSNPTSAAISIAESDTFWYFTEVKPLFVVITPTRNGRIALKGGVVQLAEQWALDPPVVGSNPTSPSNLFIMRESAMTREELIGAIVEKFDQNKRQLLKPITKFDQSRRQVLKAIPKFDQNKRQLLKAIKK